MLRKLTPIFFALLSLLWAPTSRADQPRDWMVGPQPGGTVLNLDVVFPGIQATIEHRIPIYGIANELLLKANSLMTLPFYESQADFDLRLVVLSLGGTAGWRNTFRGMEFAPGEDITRQARRHRELSGETTSYS